MNGSVLDQHCKPESNGQPLRPSIGLLCSARTRPCMQDSVEGSLL